jgi:CDP-paratose 2-epimerase
MRYEYVDKNREGDHICYISDLSKMRQHYPSWGVTRTLPLIFEEICVAWSKRLGEGHMAVPRI